MFKPTRKQMIIAGLCTAPWLVLGACSLHKKPELKPLPPFVQPFKVDAPFTVSKTDPKLCPPLKPAVRKPAVKAPVRIIVRPVE